MAIKKYGSSFVIVICSLLMTVSCQDNVSNQRVTNYSFDGAEGDPITLEVATRWIANFNNQNAGAIGAQFFGRETLNDVLSKKGCMGIRFHYALDDSATSKIVIIGADDKGNNLLPTYGIAGKKSSLELKGISHSSLRGTEGDVISGQSAKQWMSAYVTKNPNHIQAHFFGYQIIKQILSQNGCIGIRTYYALNEAGVPQLLLVGVAVNGVNQLPSSATSESRTQDDSTIADASYPCPTHCSGT